MTTPSPELVWYNGDSDVRADSDPIRAHRCVVINAGGAMSMSPSDNGFGHGEVDLVTELREQGALFKSDVPSWSIVSMEECVDSSCWVPSDWDKLGAIINEIYYECDSIVVVMGTDTLTYASSALSFMLENVTKPVVITGAMVPITETRTDTFMNLIGAIQVSCVTGVREVCVFFSGSLLRGNRSTKMRCTSYIGAFDSPNFPVLGSIGVGITINWSAMLQKGRGPFTFHPCLQTKVPKVMILRIFPGIDENYVMQFMSRGPDAIILETYGSGNAPSHIGRPLAEGIEKGVIVVNITQCLKGSVVQEAYKAGNVLSEAGVVSGKDMTIEAAYAKLVFLLGQGYSSKKVSYLMGIPLAGELSSNVA